ncbi:MAG: bifunctional UDP-N-acetylglucosamine diphosphorylase/glucosamine-1-phosphate N-acetyltransferase GlmU [Elusimicrobiales bacterium]|nr:bifunctional UDP-N-acetylglucosamine diphosphorylase/glucosamine-1-phosphate N-acetyltransferase GlmU [Elusimicrobiales bacterium]
MAEIKFSAVVLAAGMGTRMKSSLPKVLHKLGSRSLVEHVVRKLIPLEPESIIVVTGHGGDLVEEELKKKIPEAFSMPDSKTENEKFPQIIFVRQQLLKGSGRAIQEAMSEIEKHENIAILCGDAPLFKTTTIKKLAAFFEETKSDCTVMTAELEDAAAYGRIKRSASGLLEAIVEADGAPKSILAIREVNSGTYFFRKAALKKAVSGLKPKGSKGEFYLTDAIENIIAAGGKATAFKIDDCSEITGINSREGLADAYRMLISRKNIELMRSGVTILDPLNTYIDEEVIIGQDTVIYPGVFLRGKTHIGSGCSIGPGGIIEDCVIDDNAEVKYSCILEKSHVHSFAVVGPMAHLRPLSEICERAQVGNFAEVKKSVIGRGSKMHHHSYIGDTIMGENVNIGAGTITCNYDGVNKNSTVIGDGAFIGSNSNLVAPVEVEKGAYTAAGSTITKRVPEGQLGIARARQIVLARKPLRIKQAEKKS